jgi:hypothetical protein
MFDLALGLGIPVITDVLCTPYAIMCSHILLNACHHSIYITIQPVRYF